MPPVVLIDTDILIDAGRGVQQALDVLDNYEVQSTLYHQRHYTIGTDRRLSEQARTSKIREVCAAI